MAFFDELTASLKQKWLQYFQANHAWIARQMEVENIATPDGGRRPSSYLILGVVSSLEPQLTELMIPFMKLNPDLNALIDVLELNFDPERSQDNLSNPSHLMGNPRSVDLDEDINSLMGVATQEELEPSRFSPVEVVDKTGRGNLQQQPLEQPDTSGSEGDLWLDELNQETKSQPESTPDNTHARQERRSEDDEISRLFPEF